MKVCVADLVSPQHAEIDASPVAVLANHIVFLEVIMATGEGIVTN